MKDLAAIGRRFHYPSSVVSICFEHSLQRVLHAISIDSRTQVAENQTELELDMVE